MKISIIVTHMLFNAELARLSAENNIRIKQYTHYPYELVYVDNASKKEYVGFLRDNCDTYVRNNYNTGNPHAWDQGVGVSSGDIIVLMDNDVLVDKDWDKEMVDRLSEQSAGITYPSSRVGQNEEYRTRKDGFCFAFSRETYLRAGKFLVDQPFSLGYYEDDYFAYRVQNELKLNLLGCNASRVWHMGRSTSSKMWDEEFEKGVRANEQWYVDKTNNKWPTITN